MTARGNCENDIAWPGQTLPGPVPLSHAQTSLGVPCKFGRTPHSISQKILKLIVIDNGDFAGCHPQDFLAMSCKQGAIAVDIMRNGLDELAPKF